MTASIGSGTPITPVEATATAPADPTPQAIAAAPCILAAFSQPGRPVAALALPELTTTPRIRAAGRRRARSRDSARRSSASERRTEARSPDHLSRGGADRADALLLGQ